MHAEFVPSPCFQWLVLERPGYSYFLIDCFSCICIVCSRQINQKDNFLVCHFHINVLCSLADHCSAMKQVPDCLLESGSVLHQVNFPSSFRCELFRAGLNRSLNFNLVLRFCKHRSAKMKVLFKMCKYLPCESFDAIDRKPFSTQQYFLCCKKQQFTSNLLRTITCCSLLCFLFHRQLLNSYCLV